MDAMVANLPAAVAALRRGRGRLGQIAAADEHIGDDRVGDAGGAEGAGWNTLSAVRSGR